jgi:hypothetical protein
MLQLRRIRKDRMMTTDGASRPLYVCQNPECGRHYLPPADMAYPDGPASQVYCATCQPDHSPDDAARPGLNLADNMTKPRSREPRRAGNAPIRRVRTGRSKLG